MASWIANGSIPSFFVNFPPRFLAAPQFDGELKRKKPRHIQEEINDRQHRNAVATVDKQQFMSTFGEMMVIYRLMTLRQKILGKTSIWAIYRVFVGAGHS